MFRAERDTCVTTFTAQGVMERRGYSRGWVCQACDASNAATATACATCTLQRGAAKPTPACVAELAQGLSWEFMTCLLRWVRVVRAQARGYH